MGTTPLRTWLPCLALLWSVGDPTSSAAREPCIDYQQFMHSPAELDLSEEELRATCSLQRGNYLYLSARDGLIVVDVSNPRNPEHVSTVTTGAEYVDLDTYGAIILGLTRTDSLQVLSVEDPLHPQVVDRQPGGVSELLVHGDVAYGTAGSEVRVFDLTRPEMLEPVTVIACSVRAKIALTGSTLLVQGLIQLCSYDVSAPLAPQRLDSIPLVGDQLAAQGDLAVVSGLGSMLLVDVSNPSAMTVADSTAGWSANGLALAAATPDLSLAIELKHTTTRFTRVQDGKFEFVGSLPTPFGSGTLTISGDHAFVTGDGYLAVLDLVSASLPEQLAVLEPAAKASAAGNMLYLSRSDALQVVDISDPVQPQSIATLNWMMGDIRASKLQGTTLWVSDGSSIMAVDVGDPAEPSTLGRVDSLLEHSTFDCTDTQLYTDHMTILDIADPTNIQVLLPFWNGATESHWKVFAQPPYVHLHLSVMRLVDVTNPLEPEHRLPGMPGIGLLNAARDGTTYHFVGSTHSFYQAFDASDPLSPKLVLDRRMSAGYGLHVANGLSYVSGGDRDVIVIYDVQGADRPLPNSGLKSAGAVVAVENGVVVVENEAGVTLFTELCDRETSNALLDLMVSVTPTTVRFTVVTDGFAQLSVQRAPGRSPEGPFEQVARLATSSPGRVDFVDDTVEPDRDYAYRLQGITEGGTWVDLGTRLVRTERVQILSLETFPNPSHGATTIRYTTPRSSAVQIQVFDAAGRRVRSIQPASDDAGHHQLLWDGRNEAGLDVGSGVFFVRVNTESRTLTSRILRVR